MYFALPSANDTAGPAHMWHAYHTIPVPYFEYNHHDYQNRDHPTYF